MKTRQSRFAVDRKLRDRDRQRHRAGRSRFAKCPARDLPAPTADVSPGMQKVIGGPLQSVWNDHPKDAEAWKAWVKTRSDALAETLPELRSRLGVKVEPTTIAGVPAFVVTPSEIPEANRNRLLFHVHGGGYVLFPGESATREAILAAALRQVQGDLGRLPHAAGPSLSGRDG